MGRLLNKAKKCGILNGILCDLNGMSDAEARSVGGLLGACDADCSNAKFIDEGDCIRYKCINCGWLCLLDADLINDAYAEWIKDQ